MTFYTPLPESSIRLLELLPGHGGITINIHHVSLSVESTSFEALSYAWGIEERTKTIHISRKDLASASSCPFSVSPHLYSALESLRATAESGKPRWLWIDAICINQQDNDGKAMQVAMMSDIYSRAERVVVWLGNAESGSEMVMSQMPNLTTKLAAIDNLAGVSYITARLVRYPFICINNDSFLSSLKLPTARLISHPAMIPSGRLAPLGTTVTGSAASGSYKNTAWPEISSSSVA